MQLISHIQFENRDIYGYNLETATEFAICTNSASELTPDVSGNIVVWVDKRNGFDEIFAYNLAERKEIVISSGTATKEYPAIDGNIVVWRDDRNGIQDNSVRHMICSFPISARVSASREISGKRIRGVLIISAQHVRPPRGGRAPAWPAQSCFCSRAIWASNSSSLAMPLKYQPIIS